MPENDYELPPTPARDLEAVADAMIEGHDPPLGPLARLVAEVKAAQSPQPVPTRTPEGLTAEQVTLETVSDEFRKTLEAGYANLQFISTAEALLESAWNTRSILLGIVSMLDERETALAQAREQRDAVLRDVAELPNPWTSPTWCQVSCDWCAAWMQFNGNEPTPPHPDNSCLWPRALAASGRGSAPQGDR